MEHFDSDFIRSQIHGSTTLDLLIEDLIGRISSQFYRLTCPELDAIRVSVLFHILSHNLLVISSEDDLFSYISSRICSDPEYLQFLQFVRFEYLSFDGICCFLSTLSDSIDRRLWESISPRLILGLVPAGLEFPLKEARSVDGIISYLTRKHGGNVHDKGIVTITSLSVYHDDPEYAVRNVADLESGSNFCSKRQPGQWICWDFRKLRVRPTHYTVKSPSLRSWVVESSVDGDAWTEIDRKMDNQDFKNGGTASFAVSNSAECRFIRLTQTGRNGYENDHLDMTAFEIFGALRECEDSSEEIEFVDDFDFDVDDFQIYMDDFEIDIDDLDDSDE
jgi:hypothetical protein